MPARRATKKIDLLSRSAMTPMERRLGRFMRAPDHDAGTGGDAPAGDPPAADPAADPAASPDPAASGAGNTLLGADPEASKEGGDPASPDEGDQQQKDAAAALIGAPEKYEFDLGEGVTFDQQAFDAFEPVLREMDLSQDAANRLLGGYAEKVLPVLQERADAQASQAGEELRADWAKQTMADKEIGGAKLEESKAMAARAMARFLPQNEDGQRFRTFLNESGLGNHPEMMRMLSRAGRELGEASADPGSKTVAERSTSEKFFGPAFASKS
jgi:hypothetical protein